MEIGGLYSGVVDYGVQKINKAMQDSVDKSIETTKQQLAFSDEQKVQAAALETVDKAVGQIVNVTA